MIINILLKNKILKTTFNKTQILNVILYIFYDKL